ncbi:DUF6597 domain-containing transcriptional factor [Chryseolinea sp. H1M3-3]|uniref:DUF6597 domain-containing transcriptional factor n=1 Tax=Chryseolinea sp. H1M3-3 TaxID=3034144 RepID=UPI0023ED8E25|nr:DUF6597 domain-containing transcriptional factor [Chryseolinea sp. H1M3-3]
MEIAFQNISHHLHPFVAAVWASQGQEEIRSERIVPDGGSCLIFNFGGAVSITRTNGALATWKNNFFAGPATSYLDLKYHGNFEQVGVIFKPFGAFHLMKIPMSEFIDSEFELDVINKQKFQKISDEMASTECLHRRLSMLCNWLEAAFAQASEESCIPAVTSLLQQPDEISVKEIAGQIGRSQQHIARLFNKHVGVSPKKLQRIFRFQKVLRSLSNQPCEFLTTTAYQYNYFDQPHFNNEIRSFSGFTPSQLTKQNVLGSFRVIR